MMHLAFHLTEEDEECLAARGQPWEALIEKEAKWLIFPALQRN